MNNHSGPHNHLSRAERKQMLLQEGAAFRAQMVISRDIVRHNLSAKSLTTHLMTRVTGMASSIFSKSANIKTSNLPALIPLLVTGISLVSRRYGRKPLLLGGAVIAAIGAAICVSSKKSNTTPDSE